MYNKSAFIKDLKQIPWSIVDTVCEGTNACVDEAVFLWERLFLDVANLHAQLQFSYAEQSDIKLLGLHQNLLTLDEIEITIIKRHDDQTRNTIGECISDFEVMQIEKKND